MKDLIKSIRIQYCIGIITALIMCVLYNPTIKVEHDRVMIPATIARYIVYAGIYCILHVIVWRKSIWYALISIPVITIVALFADEIPETVMTITGKYEQYMLMRKEMDLQLSVFGSFTFMYLNMTVDYIFSEYVVRTSYCFIYTRYIAGKADRKIE